MKWLWFLGNLVLLSAAASYSSHDGAILGPYSLPYAFGLAASVGLVGLAAFLSFTQPGWRWLDRAAGRFDLLVRWHGQRFAAALAILLLISLVMLFSLPAVIRYIELLLLFNLIMLLVSLVSGPTHAETQAVRSVDRLLWLLLAVVLVVSFFSAQAVPAQASDSDEVGWTNIAYTWATTGQAYIKFSGQSELPLTPGLGWWVAPFGLWLQAFGVSLAAGRMFIWLFYLASVVCIGWAGTRLYDRTTGLVAAILTATSPFMLTFRIVRPEIGLAAVGALLMVLYLASRKRPLWAFVAGWLAILSLEIHAAGLAYIVSVLILYGLDSLGQLRARRNPFTLQVFAVIGGMVVGSLLYLALHVLIVPEPGAYLESMRSTRGFLDGGGMVQGLLIAMVTIVQDGLLELLLTILAIAALISRGTPRDLLVLRFFVITLVCYFVLVPASQSYMVVFMPYMAWGIAAMISLGLRGLDAPPRPALSLLAIAAFSAPFFAVSLPGLSLNPMPPTEITPVMQRVRELSDPADVVVGDVFTWWGLTDYPEFYNTWSEHELPRGLGYATAGELWAGLNPDLVFGVGGRDFPAISSALRAYLDEQDFVLVDSFEWEGHPVEFWRRPN